MNARLGESDWFVKIYRAGTQYECLGSNGTAGDTSGEYAEMRILVVARNLPNAENPTRGIFEYQQALALRSIGHEVIFAALDLRSIRRLRPHGIRMDSGGILPTYVLSIPMGPLPLGMRRRIASLGFRHLYRRIQENQGRPDVIHSHFLINGAAVGPLAKAHGIPLVHTEHSSDLMEQSVGKSMRRHVRSAMAAATEVVTVSPALQEVLSKQHGIDSVAIPNVVDTTLFGGPRSVHDGYRVVSVGSLIIRKRMHVVVRAFAQAIGEKDDVSLTIVGDGPERAGLVRLADELGVAGKVNFVGVRSPEFIAQLFKDSDLFVLTSAQETFGVVFAEALVAGLPVVASRSGGPEHFLSRENSILVAVDDVDATSYAIKSGYSGTWRLDGEKLTTGAVAKFGRAAVARDLTEVFIRAIRDANY